MARRSILQHLQDFLNPAKHLNNACLAKSVEESNITVSEITYLGSQPWPFPASIMIAFASRY
jgi:NAD+ diphosphatase